MREILAKGNGLVCQEERSNAHTVFERVMANQADLRVKTLCQVLKVSPSGYYARRIGHRAVRNGEC